MSIKKFNEYIEIFLGNREFFLENAERESIDQSNLYTLALVASAYVARNEKVRNIVYDDVRTKSQYLLYVFDKEEKETWNSLNIFERGGVKIVSAYREFRWWADGWSIYLKINYKNLVDKWFPKKPLPKVVEEEKPDPVSFDLAYLLRFLPEGVNTERYVKHPLEPTVVVEANIEQHATGKVVNAIWGREVKFDDGVKIRSYNVVPGKNPYSDEYESGYSPINSQANFVPEGHVPAYVSPNNTEFSARTK